MSRGKRLALAIVVALVACGFWAAHANAYVYWGHDTSSGAIVRAATDGTGTPNQSFVPGATSPGGVAVSLRYVYWSNGNNGAIGRANLDGTGVNQSFITGASGPGVAVDSQYIYWDNANGGSIGRAKARRRGPFSGRH